VDFRVIIDLAESQSCILLTAQSLRPYPFNIA
jgi:hypothetical protein